MSGQERGNLQRADWNTRHGHGDESADFDRAAKWRYIYYKLLRAKLSRYARRDMLDHASHGGYHQLRVGRGHADRRRGLRPASPVENRNRERAVQHMAVSIS